MCYIIFLILYSLGASITLSIFGHQADISKWGFIIVMIIVMICDHAVSDPAS